MVLASMFGLTEAIGDGLLLLSPIMMMGRLCRMGSDNYVYYAALLLSHRVQYRFGRIAYVLTL